jgi:hypothetical protein
LAGIIGDVNVAAAGKSSIFLVDSIDKRFLDAGFWMMVPPAGTIILVHADVNQLTDAEAGLAMVHEMVHIAQNDRSVKDDGNRRNFREEEALLAQYYAQVKYFNGQGFRLDWYQAAFNHYGIPWERGSDGARNRFVAGKRVLDKYYHE